MSQVKNETKVVIIGGGITGLGLAYRLIEMGVDDIVVLERGYLGVGASGRFPGGVLQQYSTSEEIALARDGIKILEKLSGDLKFSIMFRQRGSLILAHSEEQVQSLRDSVKAQLALGLGTKLVDQGNAREQIPMLDDARLHMASYCPSDGVIYPYALLWGYGQEVKRRGGEVRTHAEAKGIEVRSGKVESVMTNNGRIKASRIVNAAGVSSGHLSKTAGADLPISPIRHEFLVTEPLKHFLNPFVISLERRLQMAQSARGEVICGIPALGASVDMRASIESLPRITKAVVEAIPQFRNLKAMRQWVAYCDESPDHLPIVGEVQGVEGLIHASGFGSHGPETSTAVVKLLAEEMTGRSSRVLDAFSPNRFGGS